MNSQKYPQGWNESRVRRVLEHYESQTDEEAAAEIEAASRSTTMEVPVALVPTVRKLIAARRLARARKTHNTTSHSPSRARRKAKPQRNLRAARG